jgi:predicted nuclease with TOPRIM domain
LEKILDELAASKFNLLKMKEKKMREYEKIKDEREYTEARLSELFEITLRLEHEVNSLDRIMRE